MSERRGRTWDAVQNPKNYESFLEITNEKEFENAWKNNPDWIDCLQV